MMMLSKKGFDKGPAIGGVTMNRIGLFSGKTENNNSWATMNLSKPLSEDAQCCLEACFYSAAKMAITKSGEIVLYVDYCKLDKLLSWNRHYSKIDNALDQLQTTLITIGKHVKKEDGTDLQIMTTQSIISQRTKIAGVIPAKIGVASEKFTSKGLTKLQEIRRVKVTLSKAFVEMLEADVTMHYLPLIPAILELQHKESRAVARFCLTHVNNQRIACSTLLQIFGEQPGTQMARKRLARLAGDEAALGRLGIRWSPATKTLQYTRNRSVMFSNPLTLPPGSCKDLSDPICEA